MIHYEKFKKVMQRTEREALKEGGGGVRADESHGFSYTHRHTWGHWILVVIFRTMQRCCLGPNSGSSPRGGEGVLHQIFGSAHENKLDPIRSKVW